MGVKLTELRALIIAAIRAEIMEALKNRVV